MHIVTFIALLAVCSAHVPIRRLPILPPPSPTAGRIVGGEETTIETVPYQVVLQYSGSFICGGAIIKENVVASAAHCVLSLTASNFQFRAGSHRHSSGGQVIRAKSVIRHENYNSIDIDYDISLFPLVISFELGPQVAVINLPSQGQIIPDGSTAVISGWGTTSEGGSISPIIRMVKIPVVNQTLCEDAYHRIGWTITGRMICAGRLFTGGQDACQGDSGGPLAVNGQLTGITSWGYGCARPGYPGVWTRVPFFVEWIKHQLDMI